MSEGEIFDKPAQHRVNSFSRDSIVDFTERREENVGLHKHFFFLFLSMSKFSMSSGNQMGLRSLLA